jgi:predicted DNA binding CopG/RHH family protein
MAKQKRTLKAIPEFRNEAEERKFWEVRDSADYVDWSAARVVQFARLRPSTETISLRLPAPLLADIRALANKRDVPYQSLLKVMLSERVAEEWLRQGHPKTLSNRAPQPTSRVRGNNKSRRSAQTARG